MTIIRKTPQRKNQFNKPVIISDYHILRMPLVCLYLKIRHAAYPQNLSYKIKSFLVFSVVLFLIVRG